MTVLRCLLCLFVLTCPEFAICAQTVVITFDVPGSLGTFPESINKNGDVAGYYLDTSLQHRGFLRRVNGVLTTFDVPGSLSTDPVSIGVEGQITGSYEDTVTVHGFLRQPDGSITTFDGTDSTETHPRAISASGLITGYFFDAIGVHGFLRERNGTMTPFDVPGTFPITYPQAINRAGQITGFSFDQPGVSGRGFVRERDGSFSRPFDSQTYPVAINADGRVTGYFGDNTRSGFVSQPDGAEVFFDVVTPPLLSVLAGTTTSTPTVCAVFYASRMDLSLRSARPQRPRRRFPRRCTGLSLREIIPTTMAVTASSGTAPTSPRFGATEKQAPPANAVASLTTASIHASTGRLACRVR